MICLLRQRNNKVIRQQKRNYQTVFFLKRKFFSFLLHVDHEGGIDHGRLTTCLYFTRDFAVPTYLVVFMWSLAFGAEKETENHVHKFIQLHTNKQLNVLSRLNLSRTQV